jgi:hypothetical protein
MVHEVIMGGVYFLKPAKKAFKQSTIFRAAHVIKEDGKMQLLDSLQIRETTFLFPHDSKITFRYKSSKFAFTLGLGNFEKIKS